MRIVSLLPAATEWICAFGAGSELVGRSHECDHPLDVQDVPVVTEAAYEANGDSASISEAVQSQLQEGLSLYHVDLDRLKRLEPDLIVTQDQCEVCAVSRSALEEELSGWSGRDLEIVSMRPRTLKEVLDEALRLGRAINRLDEAMEAIGSLEADLRVFRERFGLDEGASSGGRPSVACVEWLEPLMVAGHWMPDVVEMAGGRAVLGTAGAPTQRVGWTDLRTADPNVIAIMPCGFSIDETRRDLQSVTDRDGWQSLSAVQNENVVLLDGNAYFNRPGPRLYRASKVLASLLYPDVVSLESAPAAWERQWLSDVDAPAA